MDATTLVVLVVGWLVQFAVIVVGLRWVRRTHTADALLMADLRRDVRQGLGVQAQAFGHAVATFDKQAISLLAELRAAAGQPPSPPVPAPPPSGVHASAPAAVDSAESEDEHRTVELAVSPERDSDAEDLTRVRDPATVTPLKPGTRAKLRKLEGRAPAKGAG